MENNLPVAKSPWNQLHQQLTQFIPKLDNPAERQLAKIQLLSAVSTLMPGGKPDFVNMVKYPMVKDMAAELGTPTMLMLLSSVVRDFCASVNVSRNMNADQIVEAAAMLLDECANFRLEDYVLMFAMAKRGELVKIYERVDLSVITEILDVYWDRRRAAGEQAQEKEYQATEGLGPSTRAAESGNPEDLQVGKRLESLGGMFSGLKNILTDGK